MGDFELCCNYTSKVNNTTTSLPKHYHQNTTTKTLPPKLYHQNTTTTLSLQCPTTQTLVISPTDLTKRLRILLARAGGLAIKADLLLWIQTSRGTSPRKAVMLQAEAFSLETRELKKQAGKEVTHPGNLRSRAITLF